MSVKHFIDALLGFMARSGRHLWGTLIGMIALVAFFGWKATISATPLTPGRLLELELAGTREGALTLVRAFTYYGQRELLLNVIAWDFVFIAVYTFASYITLRFFSEAWTDPSRLDRFTQKSILVAGACDCAENFYMLFILSERIGSSSSLLGFIAPLGTTLSLLKWVLILLCVGHIAWLMGEWFVKRQERLLRANRTRFSAPDWSKRSRDPRRHIARLYVLVALGVVISVVWWMTRITVCWGSHGVFAEAVCHGHVLIVALALVACAMLFMLFDDLGTPLRGELKSLRFGRTRATWRSYRSLKGSDFRHTSAAGFLAIAFVVFALLLVVAPFFPLL